MKHDEHQALCGERRILKVDLNSLLGRRMEAQATVERLRPVASLRHQLDTARFHVMSYDLQIGAINERLRVVDGLLEGKK